ncbi:MAG: hypothetical protein ACE5G1_00830 [bacterium]
MPRIKLTFVCSLLISTQWLFSSCAGSSSGGFAAAAYITDLGLTTNIGFRMETDRILIRKYQYITQILEESPDRSYFESDWKDRLPFADEQAVGVVQAKSRIIMEGRSRLRATGGATLKVKFRGENQLLYQNSNSWQIGGEVTPLCKDYFKDIANELKTEFSTRTRER